MCVHVCKRRVLELLGNTKLKSISTNCCVWASFSWAKYQTLPPRMLIVNPCRWWFYLGRQSGAGSGSADIHHVQDGVAHKVVRLARRRQLKATESGEGVAQIFAQGAVAVETSGATGT